MLYQIVKVWQIYFVLNICADLWLQTSVKLPPDVFQVINLKLSSGHYCTWVPTPLKSFPNIYECICPTEVLESQRNKDFKIFNFKICRMHCSVSVDTIITCLCPWNPWDPQLLSVTSKAPLLITSTCIRHCTYSVPTSLSSMLKGPCSALCFPSNLFAPPSLFPFLPTWVVLQRLHDI